MTNEPTIELTDLSYIRLHHKHTPDSEEVKHEFELGMGPCGRYVTELHLLVFDCGYMIIQYSCTDEDRAQNPHSEREIKRFFYPMKSVVGRVTTTDKW